MKTIEQRQKVFEYHEKGLNKTEISKLTNVSRSTIREWLNNPKPIKQSFNPKNYILENGLEINYSYLLGLYLGDGYIDEMPRTWRLRIFLSDKYEKLNEFVVTQLKKLFPENVINPHPHPKHNMITIYVYSNNIPLFFPQIGKGMKHKRKIKLMEWQEDIIVPKFLIMGLFHSDGSYYIRKNNGNGNKYPAYDFRNESDDLHKIFKKYCEVLGINSIFSTKPKNAHVYKRDDVKKLVEIIGTKEKII